MAKQRLQILVTPEQHRALGERAQADGTSVGQVVREAIDDKLRIPSQAQRRKAYEEFREMARRYKGPTFTPEELNEIFVEEIEEELEELHGITRKRKPPKR